MRDGKPLSLDELRLFYGPFHTASPKAPVDPHEVPAALHALIPYAEFWGMSDDWARERLAVQAASPIRDNLKSIVAVFHDELDSWLAGPETDSKTPTGAYVAFSAMRMAADFM